MEKIIQKFEDKWVYDSSCDLEADPPVIVRKKIRVLQEQIVEGAGMPTYTIKYPNGSKYITSKDMYFGSQYLADQKLLSDLTEALADRKNQALEIDREIIELKKALKSLLERG